MKKRVFCCLASLLCWSAVAVRAAKVDTVEVHSRKMGRAVRTIVISPEKTEGKGAAVVYLLHGYGGNETTWPSLKPELKDYADRENLIFVCPNGENSWYWDSPLNEDSQFETFVSRELVSYVDGHYRTLPSREKRAITGLSMGGHGALWLAIRHQDVFGAAGSTSGGLDIRPFPDNWDMKEQSGQKMPGCAIGTIIPSSTRRANSRMVPYGLFLIAAMMISSLKSTKPSIKSCWNEASCTTLLCVPERIRVNIGAIPSIIKSCFS